MQNATQKIFMVLVDNGDGSNSARIFKTEEEIEVLQELADNGDERYASGDGLQVHTLKFPEGFDVDAWVKLNFYGYDEVNS